MQVLQQIDALERIVFRRILIFRRTVESNNNFVPIKSGLNNHSEFRETSECGTSCQLYMNTGLRAPGQLDVL